MKQKIAQLFDIGFCWSCDTELPDRGLVRLREAGFDGIELWPAFLDKFGATQWAAALQATGMRCLQLCPYFDFVHGQEKIAHNRDLLHQYLEAAQELGCGRIRVFTGPPWGEGVIGVKVATENQWRDAIEGLREFCDIAARLDVELCLECHEGSLMEDAPSTLRLLSSVARDNLTVNLQLPLLDEDPQTSVESLAPYTTHIHIHNWLDGARPYQTLTFLEEGIFDWRPVIGEVLQQSKEPTPQAAGH